MVLSLNQNFRETEVIDIEYSGNNNTKEPGKAYSDFQSKEKNIQIKQSFSFQLSSKQNVNLEINSSSNALSGKQFSKEENGVQGKNEFCFKQQFILETKSSKNSFQIISYKQKI